MNRDATVAIEEAVALLELDWGGGGGGGGVAGVALLALERSQLKGDLLGGGAAFGGAGGGGGGMISAEEEFLGGRAGLEVVVEV